MYEILKEKKKLKMILPEDNKKENDIKKNNSSHKYAWTTEEEKIFFDCLNKRMTIVECSKLLSRRSIACIS